MAVKRGVGIDIGSNFLKIVEIKYRNGQYYLTDMFSLKIGSAEINGREAVLEQQLQEIIYRRLNGSSLRKGTVGISGKGVLHRYIHIPPVPPWKVDMMVEFEVSSGGVGEEDISFDTRLLSLPKGLSSEYTVLTSMAKSGHLEEVLDGLRNTGIKADRVSPSPLASFNAFIADFSRIRDKTILIADIGAFNTELVILKENILYFVRTLPIGGRAFTEAIQEELNLKPEQAEEMKKEKGRIITDDSEESFDKQTIRISDALKRAALQISSQIQASIRFAASNIRLEDLAIDEFY
ncbi:pilus assembly protein PilM, partial [Planctomycetota bacterium]